MGLRRIAGYAVFFIAACIIFAGLMLPRQQVAQVMAQKLSALLPVRAVSVSDASLAWPLGLSLNDVGIHVNSATQIRLDRLVLSVGLKDLFSKQRAVRFVMGWRGGTVLGRVITSRWLSGDLSGFEAKWTGIRSGALAYENLLVPIVLDFDAAGRMIWPSEEKKIQGAAGKLVLSHVRVRADHELLEQMDINPLPFDRAELQFILNRQNLFLEQISAAGPVMTLRAEGTINTANGFDNSQSDQSTIRFNGFFQPAAAHLGAFANMPSLRILFKNSNENGIPFQIHGTIKDPEVAL